MLFGWGKFGMRNSDNTGSRSDNKVSIYFDLFPYHRFQTQTNCFVPNSQSQKESKQCKKNGKISDTRESLGCGNIHTILRGIHGYIVVRKFLLLL